jgi:hypothetical protein
VISQKHYMYFVKYHPDSTHKYSEVEIKKMLEFLRQYLCSWWWSGLPAGNPMGTNCGPLSADLGFFNCQVNGILEHI